MAAKADPIEPSALREADPWELAVALQTLRRHLWPSCPIVLACLMLAMLSMLLPRFYTADATLSYDPQTPLIRGGGDLPMTDPLRDDEIDAQLAQVTSLAVAENVARTVDLAANPGLQRQADTLVAHGDRLVSRNEALATALLDHVKARRVGQTPDFTISFTAGTADQAARIANSFAAAYLKAAAEQKSALAGAGARELGGRVAQLRRQATQAEAALAGFRLANNLLDAPDSATLAEEVATLRGQLADARGQAALAGARSAAADATTVVGGGNGGTVDTTPVSALMQQRAVFAADLAALLARDGEKHPDVIIARRKLAELDAQLAQALANNSHSAAAEAHGAAARASALESSLDEARSRLAAGISHDARLLDLQNSALAARQAYQDLLKVSADQTAQQAMLQPDAQQIGIATAPLHPKFPQLGINLLVGLVLGLSVSVIVAFIRESWRHTLRSIADIDRWLEIDHFAPLPMFPAVQRPRLFMRRRTAGVCDPIDAVLLRPHSAFADGIRSLGTAALFAAGNSRCAGGRVIGITSAVAGEGKSTVSTAMGRVLAAAGMKVALLAWPGDNAAAAGAGSGSAVADGAHRTDSSGLALVPTGIPSARSQPDAVDRFVQTVAVLRREYEVIIINTPPVLAGGADRPLLECLDALVLLARWRSTPVRAIREALHRIAAAGGHVSGVALSMVQETTTETRAI